jgi:serine/threonine-protein kinase PRP4
LCSFRGFTVSNPVVDTEGYYQPKIGEIIKSKYKVHSLAGKGVFSCVVRAQVLEDLDKQVAIKILRTNYDVMRTSGEKEKQVVSLLNQTDPHDKKNVIRLYESFDYNNHLCLVYECMDLNLREVLSKFGRGIGLSLDGVCLYGR